MENIVENNKLIAEFMGNQLDTVENIYWIDDNIIGKYGFAPDELVYNTDWNWLMSVVKKIETLNYDFKILGGNWVIITDIDPDRNEGEEIIEIGGKESKLKAVYTAVIEFINWYNLKKK
jgi:hypothetical protein